MKYRYFPAILLLLLSLTSYVNQASAQEKPSGSITGQALDPQRKAVPFATIMLLRTADSSLIKGAVTDDHGDYHFEGIPLGTYLISASEIGMAKAYTRILTLDRAHAHKTAPPLTLMPASQALSGVRVQAARPFIQHRPGQTVVNVENSSISSGNTVMEVLEKSPGVMVDKDGNISLNGKNGVNVMINGRPTHLSPAQLASVLKGMPAASVSRLELMTQPPSKYSAEGTAGIINIVLKKNNNLGLNGSLTAGTGYGSFMKYNAGGALNYRGQRVSVYGNYNFNHAKNKVVTALDRNFFNEHTKLVGTTLEQTSELDYGGDNHTAAAGLDFDINPGQTIGMVVNGSLNDGNFSTYSPVFFLDGAQKTDSISTSRNKTGGSWKNLSTNIHYNWNIDSSGNNLTTNLDYSLFRQTTPQQLRTDVTDPQGNPIEDPDIRRGQQPDHVAIYAAKVDFTHPLKGNAKLEAGLKYSFVHTDNNSAFQTFKNGSWVTDEGTTNHFQYKESVSAGYLNLTKTFKNGWSTAIGLRAEQTTTHTNQLTLDSLNTNSYFELFPNVSVTKAINPSNVVSLSWARRIDRPDYESLNPFIYYLDKYTYQAGNPYLQPQFVQSLELSYIFKQRYSLTLAYAHTGDIMTQVLRQIDSTHITYVTKDNLNNLGNLTLTLGIPVTVTKWWSTYNTLQGLYNHYSGVYSGYALDRGFATFVFNTQQTFTLPHGWKADLSGFYRTSTIAGPLIVHPVGMISAGLSKSFCQDKASLKLNVQDLFQTMNVNAGLDFGNIDMKTKARLYQRSANLTFTWNFGNQKVKVKKYKNTGIQQEEDRIQKGKQQ